MPRMKRGANGAGSESEAEEEGKPKEKKKQKKMLVSECRDCAYPFRYPKSGGLRRELCDPCAAKVQEELDAMGRRQSELFRSWHPSNWLQAALPADSYLRLLPPGLFSELTRPGGWHDNANFQDERRSARKVEALSAQLRPEPLRGAVAVRRLGHHIVRPRAPPFLDRRAEKSEEEEEDEDYHQ